MIIDGIYIDDAFELGRGVFTSVEITAGTIIETSPVVVMSKDDRVLLDKTPLHDYIFEWGDRKDQCCMALGYIAVYNHSYRSNCEYEMDFDTNTISIKTVRRVLPGEQLFINYNGNWND